MTFYAKQFTEHEIEKYIEPLLDQASEDSWRGEWGYTYGWKGNPIIAAVLMYKNRYKKLESRKEEIEKELAHYKSRYLESALHAKQILGATNDK